jgi:YARHG domain
LNQADEIKIMKRINLFFILSLLLLVACSSTETPEMQKLRGLMKQRVKNVFGESAFKDSLANNVLYFKQKSDDDGPDSFLKGIYRIKGNYQIITIQVVKAQDELLTSFSTGIFIRNGTEWKSMFEQDLVEGKLDTIIDLNGDHIDEVIVDDYRESSFMSEGDCFLYAQKNKPFLEKVDKISNRTSGGGLPSYTNSTISYPANERDDQILIIVNTEKGFPKNDENGSVTMEVHRATTTYRWQPPNLITEPSEETKPNAVALKNLIALMDKEGKALPSEYCQLLGIEPGKELNNCLAIRPIGDDRYFLALAAHNGATPISMQDQIILIELSEINVVNQHLFDITYQTAPAYSFHHNTFFLIEMEMKEYKENEAGAMNDTGKKPWVERECRVLFNGKISSLADLSKPELLLCRNLIFARHGYQFKLDSLSKYFSKFDWYKPVSNNVTEKFTDADKAILALIQKEEGSKIRQ